MAAADLASTVLVLGLNPAWQKLLLFDQLQRGEVNRAHEVIRTASGKGVNVARVLQTLGRPATLLQCAGGITGDLLRAQLEQEKIGAVTIPTTAETRVCSTLLSETDRTTTELIEPAGQILPNELAALEKELLKLLPRTAAIALCGTYPPGIPDDFYANTIRRRPPGCLALLDSYRGVEQALAAGPDILKINRQELVEISGQRDVPAAARAMAARYPLACLAITDGPHPAWLCTATGVWRFQLPEVTDLVNAIGAGDCTSGAFIHYLLAAPEQPLAEDNLTHAFQQALGAACASCRTQRPASFDPALARQLAAGVTVSRIHQP